MSQWDKRLLFWGCASGPSTWTFGETPGRVFRTWYFSDLQDWETFCFCPQWCFTGDGFDHDNFRRHGWAALNAELAPFACSELYPSLDHEADLASASHWLAAASEVVDYDPGRIPSRPEPTRLRLPRPEPKTLATYTPEKTGAAPVDGGVQEFGFWFASTFLAGERNRALLGLQERSVAGKEDSRRPLIQACARATSRLVRVAAEEGMTFPEPDFDMLTTCGFPIDCASSAKVWPGLTLQCVRHAMRSCDEFLSPTEREHFLSFNSPFGKGMMERAEADLMTVARENAWAVLELGYDPCVVEIAMRREDWLAVAAMGEAGKRLHREFDAMRGPWV